MTREPVLPAVRAAVFTAVCLGLSAAAHQAMSSAPIPAWALALGGVGVYAAARVGSRRERGLAAIAALMGVLQIALHLLFAYAQHAAAAQAAAAAMPGMSMPTGASMPVSMPHMAMAQADGGVGMGAGMLIGHAVAGLICAWWLRRGEAAVHAVVRGAARCVADRLAPRFRAAPTSVPFQPGRHIRPYVRALRAQWLLTSVVLRGPPLSPSHA